MELSYRLRELVGDDPPIMPDRFLSELYILHPHGNMESGYVQTCLHIGKRDFMGNLITFESIVKKRSEYIALHKAEGNLKYVRRIENWLLKGGMNENYELPSNPMLDKWSR